MTFSGSVLHIKFRNLLNTQTETSSKVHQFYTCPDFNARYIQLHMLLRFRVSASSFFSLIYIFSSLAAEHQKQITLRSKLVYRMNMIHVDIQTYTMLLSEKIHWEANLYNIGHFCVHWSKIQKVNWTWTVFRKFIKT
jgi:hypothetical protein